MGLLRLHSLADLLSSHHPRHGSLNCHCPRPSPTLVARSITLMTLVWHNFELMPEGLRRLGFTVSISGFRRGFKGCLPLLWNIRVPSALCRIFTAFLSSGLDANSVQAPCPKTAFLHPKNPCREVSELGTQELPIPPHWDWQTRKVVVLLC